MASHLGTSSSRWKVSLSLSLPITLFQISRFLKSGKKRKIRAATRSQPKKIKNIKNKNTRGKSNSILLYDTVLYLGVCLSLFFFRDVLIYLKGRIQIGREKENV